MRERGNSLLRGYLRAHERLHEQLPPFIPQQVRLLAPNFRVLRLQLFLGGSQSYTAQSKDLSGVCI